MNRICLSEETIDIVYEDDHLLALSKPVGQLVIPGRDRDEESLVTILTQRRGCKVYVIHRLDREASGLVLFAKDAATHRQLSGQFETRRVRKVYWAVVEGRITADGIVDSPIRQFGSGRMGTDVRGKPSLTRYQVLER
jgi:tRNA pseudouridine32 synthase/23S rRNA pseudouridine746 synthase